MRLLILGAVFVAASASAQTPGTTAHCVPFAATDSALELAVANSTEAPLNTVTVALTSAPDWLLMTPEAVAFEQLDAETEALAAFTFDVDWDAPVGQPVDIPDRAFAGCLIHISP